MFAFRTASTASERMNDVEKFVEWWYGPRKPTYGIHDSVLYGVPYPLKRFYSFAGRWPSPHPRAKDDFFFTGSNGHHLHPFESVTGLPNDRVNFFMEYQGDWDGLTMSDGDDPPVWIAVGTRRPKKVCDSLSAFLVTHTLMTTLYEMRNSGWRGTRVDEQIGRWCVQPGRHRVPIWDCSRCRCPNYDQGQFDVVDERLLIHATGDQLLHAAVHPAHRKWSEREFK